MALWAKPVSAAGLGTDTTRPSFHQPGGDEYTRLTRKPINEDKTKTDGQLVLVPVKLTDEIL